ncbi:MAG: YraN family protein [Peptococcaceae bacterium]
MAKELGELGEQLAARKLKSLGYKILKVNYRCPLGEIDIIAKEQNVIVFVEVRTKSKTNFGLPQATVNHQKQGKIRKVAQQFLIMNNLEQANCRFDVVGIVWPGGAEPVVEIIKDAF